MPTTHPSACPLDCPDGCSLEVEVGDDGRVGRVAPSSLNPVTAGFICGKVARFADRLYGPDRVTRPLKRVGAKGEGRFEPISWADAVAEITERFAVIVERHGGEAILPFHYGGSNGLLSDGLYDAAYFRLLGASRLARTVCAAATGFATGALYGKMPGVDFRDYPEARFILVWGGNPTASNIHLVPYLKAAKKRGATIAVVDPRRTVPFADRHLAIRPGTDLLVALAMIGHLERIGAVDREFLAAHATGGDRLLARAREVSLEAAALAAGVAAPAIAELAELYAAASPALVRCGWGLERNRNGEGAVAAVVALPAVAGKFGVRGGGYTLSNSGAYRKDDERRAGLAAAPTRTINMNRLGRALLEESSPPIAALFVYDANPVVTIPDQNRIVRGLARDDLFTVVHDQVLTDTAVWADLVLPATTFLEHRELSASYGSFALHYAEPVVPPVGEALPNEELFRRLGRAWGERSGSREALFSEPAETALERAVASMSPPLAGSETAAELAARLRRDRQVALDWEGSDRPIQMATTWPATSDGKIHLFPDGVGERLYAHRELPPDPTHPLVLISPALGATISSTFGEREPKVAVVEIAPADAAPRGIADGDTVRIVNRLGEVVCRARVTKDVRPGVASLPKGLWRRASGNGAVATALASDDVTELSGAATFNDARVEIRRV